MADAAPQRLGVLVLNAISASGLSRLPAELYRVGKDVTDPAALLVRSADLHAMTIPDSVRAIGRAGAGTNNIPVAAMSARGVPVFNAPGANANAVKELVLAGMLLAARNLALCVADSEKLSAPVRITADYAYFRLRDALTGWITRAEGHGSGDESVRKAKEAEEKLRSLGYIE